MFLGRGTPLWPHHYLAQTGESPRLCKLWRFIPNLRLSSFFSFVFLRVMRIYMVILFYSFIPTCDRFIPKLWLSYYTTCWNLCSNLIQTYFIIFANEKYRFCCFSLSNLVRLRWRPKLLQQSIYSLQHNFSPFKITNIILKSV